MFFFWVITGFLSVFFTDFLIKFLLQFVTKFLLDFSESDCEICSRRFLEIISRLHLGNSLEGFL